MLRVIYSTGARFAGGGIGNTSYHAVRGLQRHQMLEKLLCGSYRATEIPKKQIKALGGLSRVWRKMAVYDHTVWLDYQYRQFYAQWATRHLEPADLFLGWSGYNLPVLHKAKADGTVTILDRAAAHPLYLESMFQEESQRWGISQRPVRTNQMVLQEIETADHIFIPSEFVRQTFIQKDEDPNRLHLIPFGVDTNRFQPAAKGVSMPSKAHRPYTVLFVGQISVLKGVPYLLEAWEKLEWSAAELLLAGNGQLPAAIQDRFRHLSNVRYLGYVGNPAALYPQADIFVFPSNAEGSALVTYEALACGLPVITTFNAGSIVQDGEEGYIIPSRNSQAIQEKLEFLRAHTSLRHQMAEAARCRAEEYSWDRYGDRLAQVMNLLLPPRVTNVE